MTETANQLLDLANAHPAPTLETVLPELGSDRLIGMLHAFTLLRPYIQEKLRDTEIGLIEANNSEQM